jgi:type IV pilus assembly protein PilM
VKFGFSRRSPIGLDIGAKAIVAVQLAAWGAGRRAEAATIVPRPEGAAEVPTRDELELLADVLVRQGFVGKRVVLAVPESKVFSAALELPPRSSGAPIEELARQELARAARQDVAKIEVSSWDVPAPSRSMDATHMLAMGIAHEDADRILDAFEEAGFFVEALDCRCWAMMRTCENILGRVEQVSCVLDLTDSAASLSVMHSGVVAYDRPIREAGLSRLRETLKRELRIEADAAELLLESVSAERVDPSLPESTVRAARQLIDEHLGAVVQELRSVMAYAMHRYPGAVGPVLLTGAGAAIAGLARRIREELDLDGRIVTPADMVAFAPELGEIAKDPSLAMAIGLAMHAPVKVAARRAA